jgi:hypothetical protein
MTMDHAPRARRWEWVGLAVLALPTLTLTAPTSARRCRRHF